MSRTRRTFVVAAFVCILACITAAVATMMGGEIDTPFVSPASSCDLPTESEQQREEQGIVRDYHHHQHPLVVHFIVPEVPNDDDDVSEEDGDDDVVMSVEEAKKVLNTDPVYPKMCMAPGRSVMVACQLHPRRRTNYRRHHSKKQLRSSADSHRAPPQHRVRVRPGDDETEQQRQQEETNRSKEKPSSTRRGAIPEEQVLPNEDDNAILDAPRQFEGRMNRTHSAPCPPPTLHVSGELLLSSSSC